MTLISGGIPCPYFRDYLISMTCLVDVVMNLIHYVAEDFTADEALQIGFVSRVSKSDEVLLTTTNEIVSKITRNSPVAVSITKASLNYSRDHSVAEGLEQIALQNSVALMTDDLAKSVMARDTEQDVAFAPLLSHSRL